MSENYLSRETLTKNDRTELEQAIAAPTKTDVQEAIIRARSAYLTQAERNDLRNVSGDVMIIDDNGRIQNAGTVRETFERKMIETVVVEFDGSADHIYDRMLRIDPETYDEIVESANKKIERFFLAPK